MSSDALQEFEFRLPDPGEGLTEAEIVEWYQDEGDEVREDEPLVDVETDKAVVEIPTPCTGTLEEIVVGPGEIARVGEVIAVFTTENPPRQQGIEASERGVEEDVDPEVESDVGDDSADELHGSVDRPSETDDETEGDRAFAAPSTRRYARERGVQLSDVDGTGPGGRVLRDDVDQHLEVDTPGPETERRTETETTAASDAPASGAGGQIVEPLRGIRRTIAENMQRSKREIPHVTSGFEADATELVDLKQRLDEKHEDVHITYTAILVKAIVPALKEFPLVNASVDMEKAEITKYRYYNIGVATHTDDGLMVPVVKNVDEKSLIEVAEDLSEKVEASREREIAPEDLRGGTFTITNTGSHGGHGTFGTPIIRHPEAAILGVGTIDEKPTAVDGEMVLQQRMGFSFSYDHRLIDGITAGQFMERFIEGIEDPDMLFSRL